MSSLVQTVPFILQESNFILKPKLLRGTEDGDLRAQMVLCYYNLSSLSRLSFANSFLGSFLSLSAPIRSPHWQTK
jgi:hypothetical protein